MFVLGDGKMKNIEQLYNDIDFPSEKTAIIFQEFMINSKKFKVQRYKNSVRLTWFEEGDFDDVVKDIRDKMFGACGVRIV